jgi:hypothetical protein
LDFCSTAENNNKFSHRQAWTRSLPLCGFLVSGYFEVMMKFAAYYSIIVGMGMIIQWTMSYFNRQIPELKTEPIRIGFHIFGEIVTALVLIAGGVGLLLPASWGVIVFLIAMGMLFYTAIVSPGYFAQQGNWIWVLIFAVIIALGVVAVIHVTI